MIGRPSVVFITCLVRAPNATRMPSSFIRRLTLYMAMPKMPVTASIDASRPITPKAIVAARAGNSGAAKASDQLCTVMVRLAQSFQRVFDRRHHLFLAGCWDRTTKTVLACSFCDSGR